MLGATLVLWVIAVIDWQQRRIPNQLVLVLMCTATLSAFNSPKTDATTLLVNLLIGLALTLPGYLKGLVGAGDVKLMVAISPLWTSMELLIVFASGVAIVLIALTAQKRFTNTLHAGSGGEVPRESPSNTPLYHGGPRADSGLPLGTAIAIGCTLLYAH